MQGHASQAQLRQISTGQARVPSASTSKYNRNHPKQFFSEAARLWHHHSLSIKCLRPGAHAGACKPSSAAPDFHRAGLDAERSYIQMSLKSPQIEFFFCRKTVTSPVPEHQISEAGGPCRGMQAKLSCAGFHRAGLDAERIYIQMSPKSPQADFI